MKTYVILALVFAGALEVSAQDEKAELLEAVTQHEEWLASGYTKGRKLELEGKSLKEVSLRGRDLRFCEFRNCVFDGMDLTNAKLSGASFERISLDHSRLQDCQAIQARFFECSLCSVDMVGAKLDGVILDRSNLTGANLNGISGTQIRANNAIFSNAKMRRCSRVQISELRGAVWHNTDASFSNLSGSDFSGLDMLGAGLRGTDLTDCVFEPTTLPSPSDLLDAKGLRTLKSNNAHDALNSLAASFSTSGYRYEERQVICAVRRQEVRRLENPIARASMYFFDLTCEYGSNVSRPILLFLGVWAVAAISYAIAAFKRFSRLGTITIELYADPKKPWDNENYNYESVEWGKPNTLVSLVLFSFCEQFRFLSFGEVAPRKWALEFSYRINEIYGTGFVRAVATVQATCGISLMVLSLLSYVWIPFAK